MSENTRHFDIAIVGAGPAGSAAAIRLARAGKSVLLLEKAKFPRQKLCGEFVSPECVREFSLLDVETDVLNIGPAVIEETVFYTARGRSVSVDSRWFGTGKQPAYGISRAALDQALAIKAREAGAEVLFETKVAAIAADELTLRANGRDSRVSFGLAIDATGRDASLRKLLRPDTNSGKAKYVAFKAHFSGARLADNACEIYAYDGGYGGCNIVEGGAANVCFVVAAARVKDSAADPDKVFDATMRSNPRGAETLADAKRITDWLAVPLRSYGRTNLSPAPNVITIGDAAAFIDPFTGSGILLALESARLLSDSILAANDEADVHELYAAKHKANFDRRFAAAAFLRKAAFMPLLAEPLVMMLNSSGALRRFVSRRTRP